MLIIFFLYFLVRRNLTLLHTNIQGLVAATFNITHRSRQKPIVCSKSDIHNLQIQYF